MINQQEAGNGGRRAKAVRTGRGGGGPGEPIPVLGIDLGGTNTRIGLVGGGGRLLARAQMPTDPGRGPDGICAAIADSVRSLPLPHDPGLSVGIGVAGQVDLDSGVVRHAPNLGWNDYPLRARLEALLQLPVRVINDVRAAVYGEWLYGAGQGAENLVALFVGTGIGGGVVANGQLLHGARGVAGELGHLTIERDGPRCRCGNRGCLESLAGGWAIAQRAQEAIVRNWQSGELVLRLGGGSLDGVTSQVVDEAAAQGDPLARVLVQEAVEALGAGAASVVNAFNPSILILGGGIVEGRPGLVEEVHDIVRERALSAAVEGLRIVRSALGTNAGIIGAACWARGAGAGEETTGTSKGKP